MENPTNWGLTVGISIINWLSPGCLYYRNNQGLGFRDNWKQQYPPFWVIIGPYTFSIPSGTYRAKPNWG